MREPTRWPVGLVGLGVILLFLGTVAPWEIHAVGAALQPLLGLNLASHHDQSPARPHPGVHRVLSARADMADDHLACLRATGGRGGEADAAEGAPGAVGAARARMGDRERRRTGGGAVSRLGVLQPDAGDPARASGLPHPPGAGRCAGGAPARLRLETSVVLAVDRFIYAPLAVLVVRAAALVRRIQSGHLSVYLLYLLVTLILALTLIPILR